MFDIRDRQADQFKRDWKQVQPAVNAAVNAQTSQSNQNEAFDQILFMAIWKTVAAWGLSTTHARALYDVIKAVK